jgi:hypothetical protein
MSRLSECAEVVGGFATAGTFIVALFALGFAHIQIREAKKIQREATAKDLFRDYLQLAFEHPKFANPDKFIGNDKDKWKRKGEWNEDERYKWFVAFMLNACDEIIRSLPRDETWRRAILEDLRFHKEYLRSNEFDDDGGWSFYSRELKDIWERRS